MGTPAVHSPFTPHSELLNGVTRGTDATLLLAVLPHVFTFSPDTASTLLRCGNKAVHNAAAAFIYRELDVHIDFPGTLGHGTLGKQTQEDTERERPCCPGFSSKRKLWAVFRNHQYAVHVRILRFGQPCSTHTPLAIDENTRSLDRTEAWDLAASLLAHLPYVEDLTWETSLGVGDCLWNTIASLKQLRRLKIITPQPHPACVTAPPVYPRITPALQLGAPPGFESAIVPEPGDGRPRATGREGWALGVAWEDLEELSLDNLSAQGARTIASHFRIMTSLFEGVSQPRLHALSLSTHFADLRLCESIAMFGGLGSLKHLTLATSGTKLNADCLRVLLAGCTALESLHLNDVEGRLDKDTWNMIDSWPHTLRSLVVDISESGPHHSWVLKHLNSIEAIPVAQLTRFHVRRVVHPIATLPWPPANVVQPVPLPTHSLGTIPASILNLITDEGSSLEDLCIDWWEIQQSDLEAILTNCPRLRSLQVAASTSILEIIGMTTAFGSVPDLEQLSVTSDPIHTNTSMKAKSAKSKKDTSNLPPFLAKQMAETDPTLVEVRELRRFARRLPNFRTLRWMGRQGKGEWHFSASKRSTLTPIDFVHSVYLTRQVWEDCQRATPPVYTFEEDEDTGSIALSLEVPVSPTPSASELLPLSRTTTGSSCSIPPSETPPALIRRGSMQADSANGSVLGLDWEPLTRSNKLPAAPASPTSSATWTQTPSPSGTKSPKGGDVRPSSRRRRDSSKLPSPAKQASSSSKAAGTKSIPASRSSSPVKSSPPGRGPTCSLPSTPVAMREPVHRHVPGAPPPTKKRSPDKKEKKATAAADGAAVASALAMPKRDTSDGWTKVGDTRKKK